MLLFSTILNIDKSLTKDDFLNLVIEWNQKSPHDDNSENTFEIKKNADKSTFSNCIFFMKILTFVCLATKRLPINLNYF